MRKILVVLLALAALFVLASPASAAERDLTKFGELFPNLPAFTEPTNQQLADLAQRQLDPNLDSENNCLVTTVPFDGCVHSGFTYFGQFIDHDLTLDTSPSPTEFIDPRTLMNNRTFALDLDSVYGGGPSVAPQLYEADGLRFKVQEDNGNGVRDLPRNPDGSAILVEKRNDENQVLSQIHTAMLKFHNRLIDEGYSFARAKRTLTRHYQYAVVNDYLPHVSSPSLTSRLRLLHTGQFRWALPLLMRDFTPVEFSVASFRFGHSQVRRAYRLNAIAAPNCGNLQVFAFANPAASLMGGRPLQAGRQIDWGMFFPQFPEPAGCAGLRNPGRKIDPLISSSLFQLPIPGAEATGSNVLAFRNMVRAKFYGMPSGQDVAAAMDEPVITPEELNLGPGFENGTPLWYYILAESSLREDGQRLGRVGSLINAASFASALLRDRKSYVYADFRPDPRIAGEDGMTLSDLFDFAGVVR